MNLWSCSLYIGNDLIEIFSSANIQLKGEKRREMVGSNKGQNISNKTEKSNQIGIFDSITYDVHTYPKLFYATQVDYLQNLSPISNLWFNYILKIKLEPIQKRRIKNATFKSTWVIFFFFSLFFQYNTWVITHRINRDKKICNKDVEQSSNISKRSQKFDY